MTQSLRFGNNTVNRADSAPTPATPPPIARGFLVGRTERGPVNTPVRVRDFDEFKLRFGAGSALAGTSELADMASDYFRTVGKSADAIVLRLFEGEVGGRTAREYTESAAPVYTTSVVLQGGTTFSPAQLRASATSPGEYGNNIQVAYTLRAPTPGTVQVQVHAREVVNGVVVASRETPWFTPGEEEVAAANGYLGTLLRLEYDPVPVTVVNYFAYVGFAPNWFSLTGGQDSSAVTAATLRGTVNNDTQQRTGLEILKSSKLGGGALIAPGFETAEGREVKYEWAALGMRIVPECPPIDMLLSGAEADFNMARQILNAEFAAYYYPRGRELRGGRYVSRSPLGALGGLYVASVMRRTGYVAPAAGSLVLTDIQHSPDGVSPLVTDANMADLQALGMNVIVARTNMEAQGLALMRSDPRSPVTTKVHHRMALSALAYDIGPALAQFENTYVDAHGAFYSAVESELKKRVTPYFTSGVLYGVSLADAVEFKFGFDQTPEEVIEQVGRVQVTVRVKISSVSEGIDLNLGQVSIKTAFNA